MLSFWKRLAVAQGWQEAWDYDGAKPLLVVWHETLGIHFTGKGAWKAAATYRITK